jgi:ABC-type oligopeptide transport system substrate-binding subunit
MRDTPVIPLYYYVSRHLVKPSVRGYQDNPRDVHLSRYLSIAAETP